MRLSSEDGWTLPIVLFALALLAFLSRGITGLAILLGSLSNDMRGGAALHEVVRREIVSFMNSRSGCTSLAIGDPTLKSEWASCSERSSAFVTLPAIPETLTYFDYDQLFAPAVGCPGSLSITRAAGFRAPVSSTLCIIRESVNDDLIVQDNLAIEFPLEIAPLPRKLSIVATPGYLSAQHGIKSAQDLLVFAGGDIEISLISSATSTPVRVTLISAHGQITVSKTSGNVSLLLIGRSSLRAPPTPWLPPFPLPLRRSPSILGITPG